MTEMLHVRHFSEPRFSRDLIDHMVMDPVQLRRLKALATSYSRVDKSGNKLSQPAWSADFVRGKGQGLIFLVSNGTGPLLTPALTAAASWATRGRKDLYGR